MSPQLILASASPRRRELLDRAGVAFSIIPSQTTEEVLPGEIPEDYVWRIAKEKAHDVATQHPESWVLAADTIVTIDGLILGKPLNEADGSRMLHLLSGRSHHVMTAFVLLQTEQRKEIQQRVRSTVTFKSLTDDQIAAYLATGEPSDKAGAYAVQGLGADLVERVEGSYTNVVGLPMNEVLEVLKAVGIITQETVQSSQSS